MVVNDRIWASRKNRTRSVQPKWVTLDPTLTRYYFGKRKEQTVTNRYAASLAASVWFLTSVAIGGESLEGLHRRIQASHASRGPTVHVVLAPAKNAAVVAVRAADLAAAMQLGEKYRISRARAARTPQEKKAIRSADVVWPAANDGQFLKEGFVGEIAGEHEIKAVVDESRVLIEIGETVFWLHGYDLTNAADGAMATLSGPVVVQGTARCTTPDGRKMAAIIRPLIVDPQLLDEAKTLANKKSSKQN